MKVGRETLTNNTEKGNNHLHYQATEVRWYRHARRKITKKWMKGKISANNIKKYQQFTSLQTDWRRMVKSGMEKENKRRLMENFFTVNTEIIKKCSLNYKAILIR